MTISRAAGNWGFPHISQNRFGGPSCARRFAEPWRTNSRAGDPAIREVEDPSDRIQRDHGLSCRILLTEDNIVNQRVALRILEKAGHMVVIAENGKEALRMLKEQTFDLVLMDVQMPEMGGFEATALIRDREQLIGRHTPIVAMTAHAMAGDRERCLDAGMDDYLAKPVAAASLLEMVARHTLKPSPGCGCVKTSVAMAQAERFE